MPNCSYEQAKEQFEKESEWKWSKFEQQKIILE